ncbi:hypothetical protein RUND412_006857 [Rhizina undulata]
MPPSLKRKIPLDLGAEDDDPPNPLKSLKPTTKHPITSPSSAKPAPAEEPQNDEDTDEEEDDYMKMIIAEPKSKETLTQMKRRKEREAEIRARPKSKAELAAIEKDKREEALSRSLLEKPDASQNKGFKMMKMMGYRPGSGLGKQPPPPSSTTPTQSPPADTDEKKDKNWSYGEARLEPIGVEIKEDRGGIGLNTVKKQKIIAAVGGVKRPEIDPNEYRERVANEREEKRKGGMFYAAQKICEKFDTDQDKSSSGETGEKDDDGIGKLRKVALKSIPVLWRGLVKHREMVAFDKRARYEVEQGLAQARLPGYDRTHELDLEDQMAVGITIPGLRRFGKVLEEEKLWDDLEEDDEELEEFEALGFGERLDRIVGYLRREYCYCFWCKCRYKDEEEMQEGCPGVEEQVHG